MKFFTTRLRKIFIAAVLLPALRSAYYLYADTGIPGHAHRDPWLTYAMKHFRSILRWIKAFSPNHYATVARLDDDFRHQLRKVFQVALGTTKCQESAFHGHPTLAAHRRGAHLGAITFVNDHFQCEHYEISASRRSEALTDGRGYHGHYSARDYAYRVRNDAFGPRDVLVMVDVDYYMDMHALMAENKPMLLWSFQPQTIVGTLCGGEATFGPTPDLQSMIYSVRGGHTYTHQIWDYEASDFIAADHGAFRYIYAVEVHRPYKDSQHAVVILQPTRVVSRFSDKHVPSLARRSFAERVSVAGDNVRIITGALDVTLPLVFYEDTMRRLHHSRNLSVNEIVSWLTEYSGRKAITASEASALASHWWVQHVVDKRPAPVRIYSRDVLVRGRLAAQNGPSPMDDTGVHPADGATAFVPSRSKATDAAAVIERLYDVKNTTVPDARFETYASEFADQIVGTRVGFSISAEEAIARASKASTKSRMRSAHERVFPALALTSVRAFFKAECYGSAKAPRNISPCDDDHQLNLSRLAYPFCEQFLATQPWYMPCRKPSEIDEAVAMYTRTFLDVVGSDYTKFDGSISKWLRVNVELRIFTKAFPNDPELVKVLENEIERTDAKCGVGRYDTCGSRLSGSAVTTIGNSLINAYVMYAAARMRGLSPLEAFLAIGLIYGDDGLFRARYPLVAAARALGLTVKLEPCFRPEMPYAAFIGRVWPLRGVSGSMQDLGRAIAKIGVVQRTPGVNSRSVLVARAFCYTITDRNTPILGPLCRKIVDLAGELPSDSLIESVRPFIGRDSPLADTWPGVDPRNKHVRHVAAALLGCLDDITVAEGRILAAHSLGDLTGILRVKRSERNHPSGYDSHSVLVVFKPLIFGRPAGGQQINNA